MAIEFGAMPESSLKSSYDSQLVASLPLNHRITPSPRSKSVSFEQMIQKKIALAVFAGFVGVKRYFVVASTTCRAACAILPRVAPKVLLVQDGAILKYDIKAGTTETLDCQPLQLCDRGNFHAFLDHGYLFVLGGEDRLQSAAKFDFRSNTWAQLPDMPTERMDFSVVKANGSAYVIGGQVPGGDDGLPCAVVERFDLQTEEWAAMPPLQSVRGNCAAVVARNAIYVVPSVGSFIEKLSLHEPHAWELLWTSMSGPAASSDLHILTMMAVGGSIYTFGLRLRVGSDSHARAGRQCEFRLRLDLDRLEWFPFPTYHFPACHISSLPTYYSYHNVELEGTIYYFSVGGKDSIVSKFETWTSTWKEMQITPSQDGGHEMYNDEVYALEVFWDCCYSEELDCSECCGKSNEIIPQVEESDHIDQWKEDAEVIQEVNHDTAEHPTYIDPLEAAEIEDTQQAGRIERLINSRLPSPNSPLRVAGRVLLLTFSRNPKELELAVLQSPPACRAQASGIDIQPIWANGAKILVCGLGPEHFEGLTTSEDLRPFHVALYEDDEQELNHTLQNLPYNVKKLKPHGRLSLPGELQLCDVSSDGGSIAVEQIDSSDGATVISAQSTITAPDQLQLLDVFDGGGSVDEHGGPSDEVVVGTAQIEPGHIFEITVQRTFIHIKEGLLDSRTVKTV